MDTDIDFILENLLVEHIGGIQWNKRAFDRLVLSPEKKSLITAMVKEHVLVGTSTDIIEGKGNGLIILLHGALGTGKTLTAESVAEVAEKPLYRVTYGDIGTDPEGVEKYLESVLYIATMWKAGTAAPPLLCLLHEAYLLLSYLLVPRSRAALRCAIGPVI